MRERDDYDLIDQRFILIRWNPASPKWQDNSNDFYCSDRLGNGWTVTARDTLDGGQKDMRFDDKHEALRFYVNYLFSRRMRMANGESAVGRDLVDRRYEVLEWNADSEKWTDSNNNFYMRRMGDVWRVGARHDFADGRAAIEFGDEIEAFEFFVNHLYGRTMNLMEERADV